MEEEEITLYCICRSPDIDRFMIMCDQCEEWYHGDCINTTEKESRKIKYFYCKWCRRKDPSLKIHYRKSKRTHEKEAKKAKKAKKIKHEHPPFKKKSSSEAEKHSIKREKSTDFDIVPENDPPEKDQVSLTGIKGGPIDHFIGKESSKEKERRCKVDRCGKCENCLRWENCGRCNVCQNRETSSTVICLRRICLSLNVNAQVNLDAPTSEHHPKVKKDHIAYDVNEDLAELKDIDISYVLSHKEIKIEPRNDRSGRQCYGPGCTLAARSKTKYCSDECGKRLAAKRLNLIMPSRVHEWHSTPTVANETGSAELERIRSEMTQARSELQALEMKFQRLETIIARSKMFPISVGMSDAEDNDESDQNVFCVVCGHPVSLRNAIKHMDRCYIKIEAQISFGSVYPTRIEGSERLFCDVYNRQQQTYCKRLQVICPEHAKEPKIGPNEVCGCPLREDVYEGEEPTEANEFCSRAKRKCNKHFKWESMYRASVDLQRIRQWLKIDEIFEEERRIRSAMVARAGVIPLLLHQTTAHDHTCLDMRTKPSNLKRPAYRLVI